ncbi:very short patch repair endonuclease [Leifsonia sp. F6_8S_P_1B]|uniref:Very short patch repair endonuclease n=1 Tax=Leifsonia williamsii TaxID=3035919 RepID=A0ABT8KC43_9MICO|nr:very short patch repair endonuclease [Leifsonia williamsii]MDN4614572.1 very short patch repair endonuclease [Leifsonia williamsii]
MARPGSGTANGSWASSLASRKSMQSNRGRDTAPELAVRTLLHRAGLRYRVDFPPLGGRRRADIVFTRVQLAVFIDGCFWHGCPQHATYPKANSDYWLPKLRTNIQRDRDTDRLLRDAGWTVQRFWEHEAPESIAAAIIASLRPEHDPADRV